MTDTAIIESAVLAEEASSLKGKNMYAVISGRRHSGKTCFSLNLSHALSLLKQKVMLFDGDCGLNNIKAQLGLENIQDLDEVIYKGKSLNQIIYGYDKGRFDIALSNAGSSGLSTMSVGRLQILGDDLHIWSQNYDKMILDIASGITDSSKVLSGMSQNIIILCTNDTASISDNYGLIRMLSSTSPKSKIHIVINQSNSIEDGRRTYQMLERASREFLEITPPLLGIIRQDTRMRDSIRNQTTLINRYPQSEAALDIISIAQRIIKNEQFN